MLNIAPKYKGEPLESGGTSIQGPPSPAVRALLKTGKVKSGMMVLDYGAGKYARNADFLRSAGVRVYAYDPFNGTDADGWECVSNKPPHKQKFDLAISAYVLNVVPEYTEDDIISKMSKFSPNQVHITRNMDIFNTTKSALKRKDKLVGKFFLDEYVASGEQAERYEAGELTDNDIMMFVHHGVQTSRGFQRIPILDNKGFNLSKKVSGYKVYEK